MPFSGEPAGIALALRDGTVVRGFRVESTAGNPSTAAFQMAVVGLKGRGYQPTDIVRVLLVEGEGAEDDRGRFYPAR